MHTSKGAIVPPPAPPPPLPPQTKVKKESRRNRRQLTVFQGRNAPMLVLHPPGRRRTSDQELIFVRKPAKKAARLIPSAISAVQEEEEEEEEVKYDGSSGSDHEPSTACLAEMVRDFLQEEEEEEEEDVKVGSCGRARCNCLNGSCNEALQALHEGGGEEDGERISRRHSCQTKENQEEEEEEEAAWIQSFLGGNACEILEGVTSCAGPFELRLLADVAAALQSGKPDDVDPVVPAMRNSQTRLRAVMWHLRGAGYNAAVCKSRWNPCVGFPAGDYEYIDVIVTGEMGWAVDEKSGVDRTSRYIVDIEFQAQFEIARPSRHYRGLLAVLPGIFVGRPGRLKQAVSIMADAAKRSLRHSGMHVPPWRRQGYMLAKWMSPYKRTTNPDPSASQPMLTLPSVAVKGPQVPPGFLREIDEFEHKKRTKKPHDAVLRRPSVLIVVCSSWELPVVIDRQPATKEQMASGLAFALSQHKA